MRRYIAKEGPAQKQQTTVYKQQHKNLGTKK